MIRFYPDGYPFILFTLFLTVVASISLLLYINCVNYNSIYFSILSFITIVLFVLTILIAYFFRDPEREIPEGEDIFVSPADGKVILVKDIYEKEYLKAYTKEISIFMSPLNVHVNRAPCDGIVKVVEYFPGTFKAAYSDDASEKNENIVMVIDKSEHRILVRQVAGFIARRVVCKVKVGSKIRRGERFGIIRFGSRLDVYLPENTKINVKLGEKVKAGETIIGEIVKT